MKNKELEELLNKLYKLPIDDEYQCEFGTEILEIKEIKLLLSYKETLENRNKELYEGFMATQEELTEYATKNEQLENNRDKAIEYIEKYKRECMGEEWFETSTPVSYLLKTLKGDSDE